MKELLFSEDFYQQLIDSNQVMHSGVAYAKLKFSLEVQFQIFTQKWLLGNIKGKLSSKNK